MKAEQQYIDLFTQCEAMICRHSADVLNAPRAKAFADFEAHGFPSQKVEKYKYTDVAKFFAPDYGLNLFRHARQSCRTASSRSNLRKPERCGKGKS